MLDKTLYLQLLIVVLLGPICVISRFFDLSQLDPIARIALSAWTVAGLVLFLIGLGGAIHAISRVGAGEDFQYWIIGAAAKKETDQTQGEQR